MRCPICNAQSDVLLVRHPKAGTHRRRECFNGHRFSTIETVLPEENSRRTVKKDLRSISPL